MAATWEVGTPSTTYIYKAEGSDTTVTITGLKEGLLTGTTPSTNAPTGVTITADNEQNPTAYTVTIAEGALPTTLTGDTTNIVATATGSNTVTITANGLNTETGVFKNYVTEIKSGTLTAKQKNQDYWVNGISGTTSTLSLKAGSTDGGETVKVTGLATTLTDADLGTKVIFDASTKGSGTITLKEGALNKTATPVHSDKTGFTLQLDSTVTKGGELDGTPTLEVIAPESSAATTTAKVQQKLTAGWKIATADDNGKSIKSGDIVYMEAGTDTLATIENINKAAVKDTNISLSGKTVTLSQGALGTSDITLTRTPTTDLKGTYTNATDSVAYVLDLASNVSKSASDGGFATKVENNQATVSPITAAYWTLGKNSSEIDNTKITYTAPVTGDAVVTVTGLGTGAKGGDGVAEAQANVTFDTSSRTITLKEGALPTTSLTNDTKVELKVTAGQNAYDNYVLAVDGIAKYGKTKGDPKLDNKISSGGKLNVVSNYSAGWDLDSNAEYPKTLTYTAAGDVVLAEITGLKQVETNVSDTIAKLGTDGTVTLFKSALVDSPQANATVTLANKTVTGHTNNYKIALSEDSTNGVTIYGTDATKLKPTLSVVDADISASETSGTKTAKIIVTESEGWDIDDNALNVTYKADNPIVVAKVTGLGMGAKGGDGVADANVKLNEKTITLSKGALQTGKADSYAITLTEGNTTDYEKDYVLALDADSTKTDSYVPAPAASYTGTPTVTISGGTATIQASKAEGWTLDTAENSDTKNRKVTYTPATAATTEIAKITGLNSTITAAANNIVVSDKTITLYKTALPFGESLATTYTGVALDNETVGDFSLQMKEDSSASSASEKLGFDATRGWAVDGTIAYYNQGTAEGWTLGTPATGDTKVTEITYTAAIANDNNEKAKHLITIANLGSELKVGKKDESSAEGSAVGTGKGADFKPGLFISTDYAAAGEGGTETKGKLTLNRNVLDTTATAEKTIAIAGDDAAKYQFALATDSDKDKYVPTEARTKYFWDFNSSTGAALYKQATAKYWKPDNATSPTSLTYTPETTATTIAKIEGLNKTLAAVNADEFDKNNVNDKVITGSYIAPTSVASPTASEAVISATTNYKAAVAADATATPPVAAQDAVYGEITLKTGAFDKQNVTMTAGTDHYGLKLDSVTAPSFSGGKWDTTATSATYKATATEGYSLNGATEIKNDAGTVTNTLYKGVTYTSAGDKTVATITGLSGLTAVTGQSTAPTGITLTDANKTIELAEDVLGTTTVTLTNNENLGYKLTLESSILDSSDATDKAAIDAGRDVWRLNKTTATYRHITPAYYTLAADGSSVTYTKEDDDKKTTAQMNAALYATVEGLKSGLTVGSSEAGKVDDVLKSGSDTVVSVTKYVPASEGVTESVGVVTVKQDALDAKALTLTTSNSTKYKFALDNNVPKTILTEVPTWSIIKGNTTATATLTGKTQAGWALESGDTPAKINYFKANNEGKTLATITGLATTVTADNLAKPSTKDETNTAFELTAANLTTTDAVLTNDKLPDGTELKYTIKFKDNAESNGTNQKAITGDKRWYIDDTTKTTLHYGTVHDEHYEDSSTDDGVYDGETAINTQTIKYIKETRKTPDFTIKNLASGVTLNVASNATYYTGAENTPVKYKDSDGNEQTEGIKLDNKTVTVKRAVLSQDATNATEIVNNESFAPGDRYMLAGDTDVTTAKNNQEMLKFAGGTLTYYKAKGDGFNADSGDISKATKLTYTKAGDATDDNTIATVTGLKSDLKLPDNQSLKLVDSTGAAAVTRTASSAEFTVNKNALDTSAKTTVAVKGGTLKLGTYDASTNAQGFQTTDSPQTANGWTVSGTTAYFNIGKTAGWQLETEGDDAGNIVYHKMDYTTATKETNTLFKLSNLKSGLTVSEDGQKVIDNKKKDAVTVTATGDASKAYTVTLTDYALNKKDVLLNKGTALGSNTVTLGVYAPTPTTNTDGTKKYADGYVGGKAVTKIWTKDGTKAVYTVSTTEGYDANNTAGKTDDKTPIAYDAIVKYSKTGKTTTTITGVLSTLSPNNANDGNSITGITVDDTNDKISIAKTALAESNVKLANSGTTYTLELTGIPTAKAKVWNVSKGTATYVEQYEAKNYQKKSNTEYTYSAEATEVPLVVVTGLDKTLDATEAGKGVSDTDAANKYGISATAKTRTVTAEAEQGGSEPSQNTTESYTEIALSDRTKLAAGDVKLQSKDGGKYEFAVTSTPLAATSAVNTNLGTINYSETAPLWSYSKGTVTLSTGDSGSWAVKQTKGADTTTDTSDDEYDYTVLTYTKPKMDTVATISGLNTSLVLDGNVVKNTKTTGTGDSAKTEPDAQVIALGTVTEGAAIPIQIDKQALVAEPKNNAKVTLKLANKNQYALATSANADNQAATPTKQAAVWSISKGTATYQYDTTAGWTFADDGTTVTYTTQFTTGLAKISGLNKDLTTTETDKDGKVTSSTKSPSDKIVSDKTTDVTYSSIIEVNDNLETDAGGKLTTFTLKNAAYLAGSKVTLSPIDKKSGTTYQLFADEELASKTYEAEWEVNEKKGSATLAAGTKAGYDNPKETDKSYGTTVTYVPSKASTVLATVTGLKKDDSNTTTANSLKTLIENNGALTADTLTKTISLKNDAILDKSTVTLGGKGGYTFDLSGLTSSTKIDTNNEPKLKAKSGTVTLVEVAEKDKFSLSSDGKKLVYNTKDTETVLATVKGLNKTLMVYDGTETNLKDKIVTSTTTGKGKDAVTTPGTTEVVSYDKSSGVITLTDAALAKSNVTFTLGKGVTKGDYTLALGSGVMTESSDYKDKTGWTITNGTASYKTYDMGYYKETSKGYTYVKETKGATYATISGLKKTLTDSDIASFNTSSATDGLYSNISITKNMLDSKNVTLKNLTPNKSTGIKGEFTITLDETGLTANEISTLTSYGWSKGNLTATQTAGYKKASDTSITYLKADKANQAVASLSGIKKDSSIEYKGATINLTKDNLTNANIVLTTKGLDDVDYKIVLPTGTTAPATKAKNLSEPWTAGKNKTETFTGSVTEGYTLSKSGKSVTYTKAVDEKNPKALVTVKGVSEDEIAQDSTKVSISGGSPTISSGLLPVTYSGDGTITGSKDADSITVTSAGVTVNPGKGDDYIVLSSTSGADTILYGNGDGNDVIDNFAANDTIKLTGGKVASVKKSGSDAIVTIGKQTIQLTNAGSTVINIVDKKGESMWSTTPTSSSDVLLADDNYSMDAASLSDITEPFKASYTPYDFEAGLDLVKQNSIAPAITFTGTGDKK